jgi:MFS family permease
MIDDWDRPDTVIDDTALPVAVSPHPRALLHFSVARFFERIAHYGTRSFLIFYMIDRFGNQNVDGNYQTYGILAALVVFSQIPGGLIVDIGMGRKTAVTWGGLSLAVGYFVLAFGNSVTDAIGFFFIFVGMGLYGPAMFSSLAQFYQGRESYLGAGMAYHFAGINFGALASMLLISGFAASFLSWRQGFMVCGILMMVGQVYLLVINKAFGEPLLPAAKTIPGQHDFKNIPTAFPRAITVGLIALYALFWMFYVNQYDLLQAWLSRHSGLANAGNILRLSTAVLGIAVLFSGGLVLTRRPGKPINRMGAGILLGVFALSLLLGGLYLTQDTLGVSAGLMVVGVVIVALAFAEFLVVPSLYSYILSEQQKYPNMLLGFVAAAGYLPMLGFMFPSEWGTAATWTGAITIGGTVVLSTAGYWLFKQRSKDD